MRRINSYGNMYEQPNGYYPSNGTSPYPNRYTPTAIPQYRSVSPIGYRNGQTSYNMDIIGHSR